MHIHIPKPLHGWRELVNEVGIIVVGILIALGAEQAIEHDHWRRQVDGARDALRADLADVLVNARERRAEDGCIRRRLDAFKVIIDRGDRRLPPLGHFGAPAARGWQLSSWPSTISAQIATHFPRAEMLAISNLQTSGVLADQTNAREMDDWAALYSVVGPGRPLEAGEAAVLRRLLADAAYRNNLMRLQAFQIDDAIRQTGILTDGDLRRVKHDLSYVLAGPNQRSLCGPVAPSSNEGVDAPYDLKVQPNPLGNIPPGESATGIAAQH